MTGRENLRYTARLNGIPDDESETTHHELLAPGRPARGRRRTRRDLLPGHAPAARARRRPGQGPRRWSSSTSRPRPSTRWAWWRCSTWCAAWRAITGVSVLLSSHLLHQVQQVCDRIAIFVAGDVVAMGTVARDRGQPATGCPGHPGHRCRRRRGRGGRRHLGACPAWRRRRPIRQDRPTVDRQRPAGGAAGGPVGAPRGRAHALAGA